MPKFIGRRDIIKIVAGAATSPAAGPLAAAHAQQRSLPVIGYLSVLSQSFSAVEQLNAAFRKGLGEYGYVERRNVEILYRWAEYRYDRLRELAADLVARRITVIFAAGDEAAPAAKSATATIPIVFELGGDPLELALVASLNRPGGNVTGTTFRTQELVAKRLELLHEILPAATSIGFLFNPAGVQVEAQIRAAETAARILGVHLVTLNTSNANEIDAAFAMLGAQRIGGVTTANDPLFGGQSSQLGALAARYSVPAILSPSPSFLDAGGLLTYGANVSDAYRLAGTYVGRILKGEKPGDLPVQQSTRIEMVLNLKAAKALGIEVPTATLLRATEVIE